MDLNKLNVDFGGGSLLQIANRSPVQMMSYLCETPDGKTVVIDGGNPCKEDGEYLYDTLKKRGGRVDLWIMTHAHNDHFGALLWTFENMPDFDLDIKRMAFTFPPIDWLKTIEHGENYEWVVRFYDQLKAHGISVEPLLKGETIDVGGMSFEIINDCSNYPNYRTVNDTTIVFLAHFPKRDVLFLGDLAKKGGSDLLASCDTGKLRCDIVQMAHHGQDGVDRDFYNIVKPKICLYTAPLWLWDNNSGGGKGSGPWKTLETRRWMEELGAEQSCPNAFGDYLFY